MMLLTSLCVSRSLVLTLSLSLRVHGKRLRLCWFNVMRVLSRCRCRVVDVVAVHPKICINRTTQGTIFSIVFDFFYGDFFKRRMSDVRIQIWMKSVNCHWIFMRWFITMQFSIRISHLKQKKNSSYYFFIICQMLERRFVRCYFSIPYCSHSVSQSRVFRSYVYVCLGFLFIICHLSKRIRPKSKDKHALSKRGCHPIM